MSEDEAKDKLIKLLEDRILMLEHELANARQVALTLKELMDRHKGIFLGPHP